MEIENESGDDGTGTYIEVLFDNEKKNIYELEREEFTWTPPDEMIKDLEKKLGKIVLSSNQTLIWDTLKQINYKNNIKDFGELFNN